MREWYRREGNAERSRESAKQSRLRRLDAVRAADRARGYRRYDAEKEMARRAVHLALVRGDLTRKPCEVCGSELVQAHHDDYGKPLDVRWLCTTHHGELHRMVA